jgi:hypothetical protein
MAVMALPGLVVLADAVPPHLVALLPNQPYAATMPSVAVRRTLESVERQITSTGRPFRVTLPNILMNRGAYFDHIYDTGGYDPLMPRDANNRSVTGELAALAKRVGDPDKAAEERRGLASKTLGRRYDWGATRSARGTGAFARDWPGLNAMEGLVMANAPEATIIALTRNVTTMKTTEMPFGPDGTGAHLLHDGPGSFPRYEGEVLANPRAEAVVADIGATAGDTSNEPKSSWRVRDAGAPHVIKVELDPPASGTTVLIARVTHLPGWSVRVDDGPSQQPLLANGWMLAAALPAGTQKVEFRYFPRYLRMAPWIALGTLVGLGLLLGWRRRNSEPSQRPLNVGPT